MSVPVPSVFFPLELPFLWFVSFGSAKETVTGAVENVTLSSEELLQKIEHSLSRFVEAIAVLLITSCVIPILVLLVFFWLIKVFLDLDMSGSIVKIRS